MVRVHLDHVVAAHQTAASAHRDRAEQVYSVPRICRLFYWQTVLLWFSARLNTETEVPLVVAKGWVNVPVYMVVSWMVYCSLP